MANRLKMAKINSIKTLGERGWSQRRIAEALGVDRRTVAKYLGEVGSKCAEAPPGSVETSAASKCTIAPLGSEQAESEQANAPAAVQSGGRSTCEPYREIILEMLETGLSGKRIHQDLVSEHAFPGSYYAVKRFVRRLRKQHSPPFRRMECEPGEEAQVDFGTGAPVVGADGRRRRTHVLRVVLSHSRKAYCEVVFRQTTDNFIQCIENAFFHFGGVPKTLVIDNLRAAVSKADWYDPEIHPKVESFARHYGTTILPTKPRTPRHKGKVERGVDYVQENALKGRRFDSLHAQNEHLLDWEETVADTRIHGTTRRQVGKHFREVEQAALLPLPTVRFPTFHEGQRRVHRDGHVEVAKSYYSVPPEYLGHAVWVRWNSQLVRIFNERMEQLVVHPRKADGKFSTQPAHILTEKVNAVERGAAWMLQKARVLGPQTARWSEAMIAERGVAGVRVLQGLLALAKRHPCDAIERACGVAWSHGEYRLRTIRTLLKRSAGEQKTFDFLNEHPIIRPLSEYGELVRSSFQGGMRDA